MFPCVYFIKICMMKGRDHDSMRETCTNSDKTKISAWRRVCGQKVPPLTQLRALDTSWQGDNQDSSRISTGYINCTLGQALCSGVLD